MGLPSDAPATAPVRAIRIGWMGAALRAEDWLLSGWIVLAAPLLAIAGGTSAPFESGRPVAGVLQLVGFLGALACLATRSPPASTAGPSDPKAGPDTGSSQRTGVLETGAVGPLVGGLLLVGGTAFAELGLDPLTLFFPTIAVVLALSLLQSRLPIVPTIIRRALVTPYLLSAGGIFWGVVHEVTGGLDVRAQLGGSIAGMTSDVAGVIGLLVLCAAVYYAMLIYAPRQVAEREGGTMVWLARFGLFVVSVALGLGWLSLLGG